MKPPPQLTFDRFRPGDAHQAAMARVAWFRTEHQAARIDGVLITGRSGSGKTHLLHAVANDLAVQDPLPKVAPTTIRTLTTHRSTQGRLQHLEPLTPDVEVLLVDGFNEDRFSPDSWADANQLVELLRARGTAVMVTGMERPTGSSWVGGHLRAPDLRAGEQIAMDFAVQHGLEQWRPELLDVASQSVPTAGQLLGRLHAARLCFRRAIRQEPSRVEGG